MRPGRSTSADNLDRLVRGSLLIEEAQALLEGSAPPLVLAHLQLALDRLHGERVLRRGSALARMIDRRFASIPERSAPAND